MYPNFALSTDNNVKAIRTLVFSIILAQSRKVCFDDIAKLPYTELSKLLSDVQKLSDVYNNNR